MEQPEARPERSARGSTSTWRPLALSAGAVAGVLAIMVVLLVQLHTRVSVQARETAENLLRLIERDIARNVEVLDLSLQAVLDGVERRDVMDADPEIRQLVLFDRATTASGLGAFVVFDVAGRIVLDSWSVVPRSIAPVTDREYFRWHQAGHAGLHISRPYLSRLIGREVVGLSRAVRKPDGTFDGVALATIEVSYFRDLLTRLQLGPNGVVSLVRDDGAILVRSGRDGARGRDTLAGSAAFETMRAAVSGSLRSVSAVDGVERVYTFARIGSLPLVLSVGLAVTDIYGEWAKQAFLMALVLCLICASILALTLRLTRELDRRSRTEAAMAEANAELARLSRTDALTRLANRRLFDESLDRELRRAKRTGRKLSMVLLDVDYFKRYNDRYGHVAGDDALTAIGAVLVRCAGRGGEAAFRVGGEEFAVLLPGVDADDALRLADRIRTEVRALRLAHSGSPAGIATVSLGVCEIGGDDPASAYRRTDAALYRSKQDGRDRASAGRPQPLAA